MNEPIEHGAGHFDEQADASERTYSLFNHLIGLLSLADMTFLGLIGAVIMWRIKHGESPFLDDHGREAVNFQISLLVYMGVFIAFMLFTFGIGAILTPIVMPGLIILRLIGCIRGAMAANRGEFYRYPMSLRFIS